VNAVTASSGTTANATEIGIHASALASEPVLPLNLDSTAPSSHAPAIIEITIRAGRRIVAITSAR
jgi:hypothetical protein